MRRLGAVLAVLGALGAPPASATGDILCEGDDVVVDMLVGRLQALSIQRVVIRIGEKAWTTEPNYAAGTPVRVGQAFEDDRMMLVDFTDDNLEGIIGRLRVFTLEEGNDTVSAGVFSMKDAGAHVVDCSLRG